MGGVMVVMRFLGRRGGGHGGCGHVCGFCQKLGWLEMQSMD
jgi:hypothetical protein